MWFIGVEVGQETSAPPPKKNSGSAPDFSMEGIRKRHPFCQKWYTYIKGQGIRTSGQSFPVYFIE